ncbi:MAG: hypothetical protein ABJ056_11775 [Halioglobus sp.]
MSGQRSSLLLMPAVLLLASCTSAPTPPAATSESINLREGTSTAATLAATCSGCHAPGSNGDAIVSLDGYTSEQIYTGFQRYRQDPNGATAMHRMARGYSTQQVQLISDYLGQP